MRWQYPLHSAGGGAAVGPQSPAVNCPPAASYLISTIFKCVNLLDMPWTPCS